MKRNELPYNERLSFYPQKGVCGLPESQDSIRTVNSKVDKLVKMMSEANHVVVLTGAGISTNAGILDFRGPKGIWTKEEIARKNLKRGDIHNRKRRKKNTTKDGKDGGNKERNDTSKNCDVIDLCDSDENDSQTLKPSNKEKRQDLIDKEGDESLNSTKCQLAFESAIPTKTHRSITRLTDLGIIKYVITQNVDGLHRRSGLPRSKLAILHGCLFTEKCDKCGMEYFRDFDVGGVSFQKTGRKCDGDGCNGDLCDTILDWEDELPEVDWAMSQEHCQNSDLVIAVGTSLRIEPAGSLPTLASKFVIINKQVTPYDERATLIIRADVDEIFTKIMELMDKEWKG